LLKKTYGRKKKANSTAVGYWGMLICFIDCYVV